MTLIVDEFGVENVDCSRWSFNDMGEHLSICHQSASDFVQGIIDLAMVENIVKVALKLHAVLKVCRMAAVNEMRNVKVALHFRAISLSLENLQT